MISQDKIMLRGHDHLPERVAVTKLLLQIGFVNLLTVDVDSAIADFYLVPGHSEHSFDEGFVGIPGIPEDHDIPAMDVREAINESIDEDPLLVDQVRLHARTFDLYR